jgi:hypothetical protein
MSPVNCAVVGRLIDSWRRNKSDGNFEQDSSETLRSGRFGQSWKYFASLKREPVDFQFTNSRIGF